jgi:hypothetical protein
MGGDRDGNPNVTAETTRDVVIIARLEAVNAYFQVGQWAGAVCTGPAWLGGAAPGKPCWTCGMCQKAAFDARYAPCCLLVHPSLCSPDSCHSGTHASRLLTRNTFADPTPAAPACLLPGC